jgi:hypothetical protein
MLLGMPSRTGQERHTAEARERTGRNERALVYAASAVVGGSFGAASLRSSFARLYLEWVDADQSATEE